MHCFEAAKKVASEVSGAIPILFGDHNVTFDDDREVSEVVPWDYGSVPSKKKERDWIFYPKDTIDQLTLLSHTNDRVAASDGQHWAVDASFLWRPSLVKPSTFASTLESLGDWWSKQNFSEMLCCTRKKTGRTTVERGPIEVCRVLPV